MLSGQYMKIRDPSHAVKDFRQHLFFALEHQFAAHRFFEAYRQSSTDGLQKRRCASVFTGFDIFYIMMSAPGIGPGYGTAARMIWNFVSVKRGIEDQYAGCARASEEFMR